jgi:hypothetical protein
MIYEFWLFLIGGGIGAHGMQEVASSPASPVLDWQVPFNKPLRRLLAAML